ncbi:hypothetical protein GF351_03580 [Candidatus Woesearchaeota archaeon]|nr:hypothetical protein [Candidatus Woesearchaeota archaeon]
MMDKYHLFQQSAKEAALLFSSLSTREVIRIVSHLDADGISAAAILIRTLNQLNRRYSISIVQQLSDSLIDQLKDEKHELFFFTDLGSGQIKSIAEKLSDRKLFILDHHEIQEDIKSDNIFHVNPHLFGIEGSKEISGAGVVYTFAKNLYQDIEKHAHIAVIGAIGDIQEDNGFQPLNDEILQDAVRNQKIEVQKGLRLFGIQTRPLHKALEYNTKPYIPGVTGSESGAIQFLHQIGIEPRTGSGWKKAVNLTDEEMKKLVTGIIMKRLDEDNPDDVLGNIYMLPEEPLESPTRDAREFSTLLNACGRMKKASLGIGACIGDRKTKEKAIGVLKDYKKAIIDAMRWYEKNPDKVIRKERYVIINAEDNIPASMIGTLASILSKSNQMKDGTYVMSLARTEENTTKVSMRMSGDQKDLDLRQVVMEITQKTGGESGGHMKAAGAIIPVEKESDFICTAVEVLDKLALEEPVA